MVVHVIAVVMASPPNAPHAELFLRESVPLPARERQDAVLDRLRRLESAGDIESLTVDTWGAAVPLRGDTGAAERGRYATFARWAADRDAALAPFFQVRERGSMVDTTHEVLTLPVLCLAVHEDGDLRTVYPHADDGGTHSVADGIEYLATRAAGPTDATPAPGAVDAD